MTETMRAVVVERPGEPEVLNRKPFRSPRRLRDGS